MRLAGKESSMRLLIPDIVWKRLLYAFIRVDHGVR
jgi:hypothetical protein